MPKKLLFISFFVLGLSDLNFDGFFKVIYGITITSITSVLDELILRFYQICDLVNVRLSDSDYFLYLGFISKIMTLHSITGEPNGP